MDDSGINNLTGARSFGYGFNGSGGRYSQNLHPGLNPQILNPSEKMKNSNLHFN
jgi:hypothetical protein